MSASTGIKGFGSTLAGSSLGTVVEITTIGGPNIEVDDIELTHMASPNGYKEFIGGLIDGGTIDLTINYTKAQITALSAALGVSDTITITLPDTSTWVFGGYVKSLGQETPMGDKISNSITIKASGKPTFTAAS
jgi:hypothetical protein